MKFRLLDFHQSGREDLPRILLYSVLVHYMVLYFMVGNPFLILLNRGGGQAALNVDLIAPGQDENDPKKEEESRDRYPIVFQREGTDEKDRIETQKANADPLSEEGMNLVEAAVSLPSPEKKQIRKPPPNMTGPQDCMLKLIDKVCPNGDFQCIEAYKSFCENLPQEIGAGDKVSGAGQKQ